MLRIGDKNILFMGNSEPLPYLSFIGNEDFTLKTYNTRKNWDGTLEYSTDKTIWNTWDGTEVVSAGNKLYLRGTGNTKITGGSANYRFVFTGTSTLKITCKGNIENLLDYNTVSIGEHPTMNIYCYAYMFQGCTALTTAPELPAITLPDRCYFYMFYNCTSLTSASKILPATNLTNWCYAYMFQGCTALTTAPELPATTLAEDCYYSMFRDCTSLITAPELPATTLAYECYGNMFYNCISLTESPSLPATTLDTVCYIRMFYGCSSLITLPALPAITLVKSCYSNMFYGCSNIKLSTIQTDEYQTEYRIPILWDGVAESNALSSMFTSTGGTFTGTPSINTTYYTPNIVAEYVPLPYLSFLGNEDFTLKTGNAIANWNGILEYSTDTITWNIWNGSEISSTNNALYLRGTGNNVITGNSSDYRFVFTGTDSLKITCKGNIENLLDYNTVSIGNHPTMNTYCYAYMFYNCTTLITTPNLTATTLSEYCYNNMFYGCTSLKTTTGLPATTLANYCYERMFEGCTSLTTALSLPATTLATYCYQYMFKGCTALTTAPELPATTLAEDCYYSMFRDCTSLTKAPALPATTLAVSCYDSMFYSCTALTTAPTLPATTLANNCYAYMFYGCTALTTAPELPTTTLSNYCYKYMFKGCTSLTKAPALPATTLKYNCYERMFEGCTSLTTAPELPATTLAPSCYSNMFSGCTSLTKAPALPATTLTNWCYQHMFGRCTSLTTIPSLPATTLANNCYYQMFKGCSNIKLSTTQTGEYQTAYRIPTSGTGTTATNALSNMFASTGGTFTGTPSINTTYYLYKKNQISFTIGSTTYNADADMSWDDWIHSEYNTNGYTTISIRRGTSGNKCGSISVGTYVVSEGSAPIDGYIVALKEGSTYTEQKPTDTIVNGGTYIEDMYIKK